MNWHVEKWIFNTHLFMAFQTTLPLINGTTWVKLKPESITNMHSAGGRSGWSNKVPWGITEAALCPWNVNGRKKTKKHKTRRTSAAIVRLEFILLKHKLIVDILNVRKVKVRLRDQKRRLGGIYLVCWENERTWLSAWQQARKTDKRLDSWKRHVMYSPLRPRGRTRRPK